MKPYEIINADCRTAMQLVIEPCSIVTDPPYELGFMGKGWGTALKPAWEPICVARKPLIGTVAANVLAHGTGALNIDGCRVKCDDVLIAPKSDPSKRVGVVGSDALRNQTAQAASIARTMELGRWPANLIHDGSDEVLAALPGGEARFFYCAKASKADRNAGCEDLPLANNMRVNGPRANEAAKHATLHNNTHPTVKPTELMRYLCRLVTPPGGLIPDPFTGSGSTGKAAVLEGFRFIGCEMSTEYAAIAEARIAAAYLTI